MVSPSIQDLRIFQWGKETVRASVTLTMDTQPTATDTFTLGTKLYTFLASGASEDGEINRGADLAAAKANTIAAINGTDGWNTAHPYVEADSAFSGDNLVIRSRRAGTAYNSLASTETFTAVTNIFSAVTFTGGIDRGTDTAATSKMLAANLDLEPTDQVYHPMLLRGLIQRWKGNEVVIERGTQFSIPETPAFYEQFANWMSMSVRGGVRPTGSGPYVYTYTRDPTGDPDIDTWTLERRLSDGIDYVDHVVHYAFLRNWTVRGAQNQPVMFTAEGSGRRIKTDETLTASQSAPSGEQLLSSGSKVYIDSAWGSLGGSQVVGQILNWEIAFNTGYAPLFTTDGRSDLDFTTASLSSENTQLAVKITMLVKPSSGGQFDIEQAAAEAQTLRAIRIQCDGTSSRQVQFDMLLKHNLGSLFKIGEFEGQDIVEMNLVESTDGTNLFRVKVTNNVSAMV